MMTFKQWPIQVLGILFAFGFASCSVNLKEEGMKAYKAYDLPAKFAKNPSEVRVKVSLSKQRVYVMEGDEMLFVMPVSIGAPTSATPVGNYRITSKEAKHRSHTHGVATKNGVVRKSSLAAKPAGWFYKGMPMPYWCEFKKGYGFHTGWVKHSPCSDGCIRMHENLAPKFFQLVSIGTPVEIAYSQAEDQNEKTLPLPLDAGPFPDYPLSMYLTDEYFTLHKHPKFD